ncbi:MAG: ribose 5-phosphate isomerase B [Bacteroidota bacterium]
MVDLYGNIAIGCDHAGYDVKKQIMESLEKEGFKFHDYGCYSNGSVDYPDMIHPLAKDISEGKLQRGIIICGSGNGVAIVANKYRFVRAALCWNEEITRLARMHNDANVCSLPARFITQEEALNLVRIFLSTGFEGERHQRRVEKISNLL